MTVYTDKTGKIRLYDGTGTPFYLELNFTGGDFSGPMGPKRTEEILQLDNGNMNANAHYIEGPDDPLMEPIQITFSMLLGDHNEALYFRQWVRAMNGGSTTINTNTVTTTKGDTQRNGSNNNPAFADSSKLTCNIEVLFDGVDDGVKYAEVYIGEDQAAISRGEKWAISATGMCYGTVTDLTTFTTGTNITS